MAVHAMFIYVILGGFFKEKKMVFKKLRSPYETTDVEPGVADERETVNFCKKEISVDG